MEFTNQYCKKLDDDTAELDKLREKIRLNESKDTELIIKLDNKIYDLRQENNKIKNDYLDLLEENKMLKAKLYYSELLNDESNKNNSNSKKTRRRYR